MKYTPFFLALACMSAVSAGRAYPRGFDVKVVRQENNLPTRVVPFKAGTTGGAGGHPVGGKPGGGKSGGGKPGGGQPGGDMGGRKEDFQKLVDAVKSKDTKKIMEACRNLHRGKGGGGPGGSPGGSPGDGGNGSVPGGGGGPGSGGDVPGGDMKIRDLANDLTRAVKSKNKRQVKSSFVKLLNARGGLGKRHDVENLANGLADEVFDNDKRAGAGSVKA